MDSVRKSHTRVLVILAVFLLGACSVLEDRTSCPCRIAVLSEDGRKEDVSLSFWIGGSLVFADNASSEDFNPAYVTALSRKVSLLCAMQVSRPGNVGRDGVSIALGSQADSIYACIKEVDCRGDTARVGIRLHKQFATLKLNFVNVDPQAYDYDVTVTGNVRGLSLPNLAPIPGYFEYRLPMGDGVINGDAGVSPAGPTNESAVYGPMPLISDYLVSCRVPRQKDDSLMLLFCRKGDGVIEEVYPLGRELARLGYDWAAEDLADVLLNIDYALLAPSFVVGMWIDKGMGVIEY